MDPSSAAPHESDSSQLILNSCINKFASSDFIMEPDIFSQLKIYFQTGGNPEQVIDLLSTNYMGVAQMANLLAEWLILGGDEIPTVQRNVENHLYEMILKNFDPKKADAIFADEGEETPSWLAELIEYPTWRSLIYRLAEEHPDCLMLNFTIKLISDAGFQGEITSISTAAQQIEVFSRILKTSIVNFLNSGSSGSNKTSSLRFNWNERWNNMDECTKMICHGQHTYVYAQVLLSALSNEPKFPIIRRLMEEIEKLASDAKHNVIPITMALTAGSQRDKVVSAISSMISRRTLNPADISTLYKFYHVDTNIPSVAFIRLPEFLDMLIEALFRPGSKLNPEHKSKYIYLLAYASSVVEKWDSKKNMRKNLNKEELKGTTQAIEKVHSILITSSKGRASSVELISELNTLFQCIRFPVVSVGVIRWVEEIVSEPTFFSLSSETCPVHFALLDEVVSCHPLLHDAVFKLLTKLFESHHADDLLEDLAEMEIKKMLIDRFLNLMSRGYVIPIVRYVRMRWVSTDTDISLIRYFVTEVMESICTPYSQIFISLFLPLVENSEIVSGVSENVSLLISSFISKIRSSSKSTTSNRSVVTEESNN